MNSNNMNNNKLWNWDDMDVNTIWPEYDDHGNKIFNLDRRAMKNAIQYLELEYDKDLAEAINACTLESIKNSIPAFEFESMTFNDIINHYDATNNDYYEKMAKILKEVKDDNAKYVWEDEVDRETCKIDSKKFIVNESGKEYEIFTYLTEDGNKVVFSEDLIDIDDDLDEIINDRDEQYLSYEDECEKYVEAAKINVIDRAITNKLGFRQVRDEEILGIEFDYDPRLAEIDEAISNLENKNISFKEKQKQFLNYEIQKYVITYGKKPENVNTNLSDLSDSKEKIISDMINDIDNNTINTSDNKKKL